MPVTDTRFPPATAAKLFIANADYRARCYQQAIAWARANPSDYFAFSTAMKDYRSGLAYASRDGKEGYSVTWETEHRETPFGVHYVVEVPRNMAR